MWSSFYNPVDRSITMFLLLLFTEKLNTKYTYYKMQNFLLEMDHLSNDSYNTLHTDSEKDI